MLNIAINGFGRIGRNIVRAYYERPELHQKIKIVAINDLGDSSINAHLLQFDSVHGYFHKIVTHDEHSLTVENNKILCFSERDPSKLPWKEHKIDLVCECTGLFTDKQSAAKHITAGAKKVLISAPGKNVDATVVYGINDQSLKPTDKIISNASCTTNCLAPIAKPLNDSLGIETGLMTTIHAYTNDQQLSDSYHSDVYRARSATMSMIPTKTGAASAISEVIPELIGKLDGMAVRVPTINVSLVDFSFNATRETSKEEVNTIIKDAAENSLQGILNYSDKPLVSIDYNHNPHSSNFDSLQTKVKGSLVKVMSWYDNEWGFCNRMLDNINAIFKA
ncbi:MAG: type I glyceraldehyde-3-phosphate dehydrogenase [Pseudomonadota bacterium]|nr:type I glyceraldehyde-3-phosphate dehydrogenase [Pseudomonadota bacterium]